MFPRASTFNTFLQRHAKVLAIGWTLLILLACFLPANELHAMPVPLSDKLAHFVLFAVFSFLWLLLLRSSSTIQFLMVFILSCLYGWLVEEIQGLLPMLGRSKENLDVVADIIGALIGVFIFILYRRKNAISYGK